MKIRTRLETCHHQWLQNWAETTEVINFITKQQYYPFGDEKKVGIFFENLNTHPSSTSDDNIEPNEIFPPTNPSKR